MIADNLAATVSISYPAVCYLRIEIVRNLVSVYDDNPTRVSRI